jgi:hypothetical protein
MAYRNQEDWRLLIEEQQSSGLSAAAFCRDKNISAKYFSLRKQKLNHSAVTPPTFIKASVKSAAVSGSKLEYKGICLTLENSSAVWVAQLLRELTT